ncbi:MAG: hypothetical protein ACYS18_12870, partial [Planctomycetota bacterium]
AVNESGRNKREGKGARRELWEDEKTELIRAVQEAEGHTACFGESDGQCEQADCCFMQDCLKIRL